MKIVIGCDHTGIDLKKHIIRYLEGKNISVNDVGTDTKERTHYPLYAKEVATILQNNEADYGILICGTGVGMSISANKFHGIKAFSCSEPYSAKMGRAHNNANVLTFGARVVGPDLAEMIVEAFINQSYEGGRHQQRVDMIDAFDD